jgi:hypothetical protein
MLCGGGFTGGDLSDQFWEVGFGKAEGGDSGVIYGSDQNHQLLPSSGSVKRKVYSFAA